MLDRKSIPPDAHKITFNSTGNRRRAARRRSCRWVCTLRLRIDPGLND